MKVNFFEVPCENYQKFPF